MADIDGFSELYAQICREWNKAEEDVKRAEQVCEEVIIPSIMELRYAGRRLAQALELMSQGGKPREVEKSCTMQVSTAIEQDDAIDAATAQIAKTLTIVVDKLHYSALLQAFPAFPALRAHLQKLRDKIVATRGAAATRDRIYETVESSDFPALLALFADFGCPRPEDLHYYLGRLGYCGARLLRRGFSPSYGMATRCLLRLCGIPSCD
jgi:hypothetical protein